MSRSLSTVPGKEGRGEAVLEEPGGVAIPGNINETHAHDGVPTYTVGCWARPRLEGIPAITKRHTMPMRPHPTSFGVFKPVDHVLLSFATAAQSNSAVVALRESGFKSSDISLYTPGEMQAQAEEDIGNAGGMASLGQDLNLVKAHLELALQGQSFVVVKAPDDELVAQVTDVATRHEATRAQRFGTLVVEELIPPGTSPLQIAESPDRGLDEQSPSRDDVLSREADA